MVFRFLTGIDVDDLLTDWSKYCRAHHMTIGVPVSDKTHSYVVCSGGRECNIYIETTEAENPLQIYLDDLLRRRTDISVSFIETEKELRDRSLNEDDTVGIIE